MPGFCDDAYRDRTGEDGGAADFIAALPQPPHRSAEASSEGKPRSGVDWSGGMNGNPIGGKNMEPASSKNQASHESFLAGMNVGARMNDLERKLQDSELRVSELERENACLGLGNVAGLQQQVAELKGSIATAEEYCRKMQSALAEESAHLVTEQSRNRDLSANLMAVQIAKIEIEAALQARQSELSGSQRIASELQARCDNLSVKLAKAEKKLLRRHGPSLLQRTGAWMQNSGSKVAHGIYLTSLCLSWILKWSFRAVKVTALAPLYYAVSFLMLPTALVGVLKL